MVEHRAENSGVAGSSPVRDSILFNNKIFFKYILNNLSFTFVNNFLQKSKNITLLINNSSLTYLMVHFRLSSVFYSSQLVDIFSYEIASAKSPANSNNYSLPLSTITVYNIHSLYSQDRFFIFVNNTGTSGLNFNNTSITTLDSIAELYPSANWLEREVSELNGITFSGKKDLRNLMLQYGDSSAPFKKSFPSIGLKEMYYEPLKDTLVQNPITVQL